ncbi:MAG: SDR family oxidoreductase [Gemmatimonadaceae bacterium]|jgi:NAD(P)-dependent dehydrogenase (short-subunit alcohol dehydrogenase family)|nr:SDR family oxidoreductase [Gemmatimonadaceae bacterium]
MTGPDGARPLADRTAVVTGGTRGIGWAVARALAGAGAHVVLVARGREALDARVAALGEASAIACDVTHPDDVARAVDALVAHPRGTPDLLVNNAGLFPLARIDATSVAQFRDAIEANLVAPFHFVHALLPAMRARGRGHIITIGSVADRTAFPENAAYAAGKTGLRAMHEVLRLETQGSGIRTSLVSPGPVNTSLWDPIDPDQRPGFPPRRAMLTAEAVADAVRYVATCDADTNIDELRLSRA